jgi:hypothetical protein
MDVPQDTCRFTAQLWRWKAQEGWFFVTLPEEASALVRDRPRPPRGFGSVRVRVTAASPAGEATWETSVFPDAESGRYVLPVKKAVRRILEVDDGDPLDLVVDVLD